MAPAAILSAADGGAMLVYGGGNRHRKFAFIHVQKTGGTSVGELLRAAVPDITDYAPRHLGARHAKKKLDGWDGYYRFAFVRNPWDRLVSWYCMIDRPRRALAEGTPLPPSTERWLLRHPLPRHVLEDAPTFEEFVTRCVGEFRVRGAIYSFTRNQLDYLATKDGKLLVDFVGKFERLHEDLAAVLGEIGLDVPADGMPHSNRSRHGHYSAFYTPETEGIVRERFARDIEYFGYEFEAEHSALHLRDDRGPEDSRGRRVLRL